MKNRLGRPRILLVNTSRRDLIITLTLRERNSHTKELNSHMADFYQLTITLPS